MEDFRIVSETCAAAPVKPDTSCTIVVHFTPRVAGRRSGFLAIRDDAVGGPHQIALSGEGVAPSIPGVLETPRRAVDIYRIDQGWCCAGGTVRQSSRQQCLLKNGTFQSTEDAAQRQCGPVIR